MTADTTPENAPGGSPTVRTGRWRLPFVLAAVLGGLIAWRTLGPAAAPPTPETADTPVIGSVFVTQQRPEFEPTSVEVPLREGGTVLSVTLAATEPGGEAWASQWRGDGPMALLESLGGVSNAGPAGGAEGLNWQFEVNGEYATRGAGDFALEPDDRVLWKLAPYE